MIRVWKTALGIAGITMANLVLIAAITGVSYASADSMMSDYSGSSINMETDSSGSDY